MRTFLNVAEKPSAAREISFALARAHGAEVSSRASPAKYISISEFVMPYGGAQTKMMFTSVLGHLKTTDFEPQYRKWGSCDPAILLNHNASSVTWFVSENMRSVETNLRNLSRTAHTLILWLDCDSEGEKIAMDVADVCSSSNSRLTIRRAKFSAMTRPDLLRAMSSLGELDLRMVAKVASRQEIDLRAGAAFTRFLTQHLGKFAINRTAADGQVISYGPCQFPTLGLVVDRWLTIENFIARSFWVIDLQLQSCRVAFDWARARLFDEYSAQLLYELCVEECNADGRVAVVERVEKRMRERYRPLPLCTVELQKIASRHLGLSSDATMTAAEKLYNAGLISYPRTETDKFDKSYDLQSFVRLHTENRIWGHFATRLMSPSSAEDPVTFQWPRNGSNDDRAHPPIHPTAAMPESFENDAQRSLYYYITRRFLACCAIDARGAETKVQLRVGRSECFGARGLIVQVMGYLEIMQPYEQWTDRNMPSQLLQEGAQVPIEELLLRSSQTKPPPLLSEADLIALMDRHGIGTDATIAEHIKKVQDRGYVRQTGDKRFEPSPLGVALVEALERSQILLARPTMRSCQEESFRRIQSGELEAESVRTQALSQFADTFQHLRNNRETLYSSFASRFQSVEAESWTTTTPGFCGCRCGQRMDLKSAGSAPREVRAVVCQQCGTRRLPRNGDIRAVANVFCPICQYQVLNVKNTQSNNTHYICPNCYDKPPSETDRNPSQKGSGDFRCYNCTHDTCTLATGTPSNQSNVAACPVCSSACSVRKSSRGNSLLFRVSCDGQHCSWVYFFPENVEAVKALDGPGCTYCSSRKLIVTWKRTSVPPGKSGEFRGCIWCGRAYKSELNALGHESEFPRLPHPGAPEPRDIETITVGHSGSGASFPAERNRRVRGTTLTRGRSRRGTGHGRSGVGRPGRLM